MTTNMADQSDIRMIWCINRRLRTFTARAKAARLEDALELAF
jgi:hypothetical protein